MLNVPARSSGADAVSVSFVKTTTPTVIDPVNIAQNDASIRWDSIDPRDNISTSGFFGSKNYINEHARVEFDVYASSIDLQILAFTAILDVLVDGKYVSTASITNDASGAAMIMTLTWPTKKKRNIKIYGINFGFAGVYISKASRISAPNYARRPLVFVLGDSYTQGTGAQSLARAWCNTLGALMGWDVIQCGIGSTGWTSSSTNLPATRVSSDMQLRTHAPDRILCALGFNDNGGNMPLLQSQFVTAIDAIKAAFPAAVIQVIGPWTPLGETGALAVVKRRLIAACAGEGVAFGDISAIITAGNSATFGLGDSVHPNDLGHRFIGQQIAGVPFSVPSPAAAFNPSDKTTTVTLSTGNLLATVTSNTGDPQVRSVGSRSSGKGYFEIQLNPAGTWGGAIGLSASGHAFTTYLGGDASSVGVWLSVSNTFVVVNNITVYNAGPGMTTNAGDVWGIAVDMTAKKMWFRNSTAATLWNNDAGADPVAGTNGIDISSISGALFITVENDTTGDSVRINTPSAAYENSPPSGYSDF